MLMKILIIQNKRIGDVLVASIIPNHLKKVYPKAEITFFCYDNAAPVLDNNPNIDKVIRVQEKELKKIKNLLKYGALIRKKKFDLIVDPYVKFQSQILCLMSGAKRRVAFEKKTIPFAYTHQVSICNNKASKFGKAIDDRVNLTKSIDSSIAIDPKPQLFLTSKDIELGREKLIKLDPGRKTIMIGILGSNPSKSLPLDYTVSIINFITENYPVNILFNYIPSQQQIVDQILERVKGSKKLYTDIVGNDIREFIQIMYHCDALIANEGGSVHIAKALGKATFTIFSPYIIKDNWATFENEPQNKSIHLREVRPDLYQNKSRKKIAAQSEVLYKEFIPSAIIPQLQSFMIENEF